MDLKSCMLCPRRCGADRLGGDVGYCGAGKDVRIALVSLHQWEEPCLTGSKGAGTVFFSHCNMKCVFCQNYDVSHHGYGFEVTDERLCEIFLEQQQRGAASLDLVTPTHYVPQIIRALEAAKGKGFSLPVVYNCGGYELPETIEALRGYVDVFLPDLKYYSDSLALRYSQAPDYFRYASAALEKMFEITGPGLFDSAGKMIKGLLVRHLVMPGSYKDSLKLLDYLADSFGNRIFISIMNQFTPMPQASGFPEINRKLTTYEYTKVLQHAEDIGLENCFIQRGKTAAEKFIPVFNGANVQKVST